MAQIHLIELTETWAAEITLCGNAETLGIDNDTAFSLTAEESACAIVEAGQNVVVEWSPGCEAADVDSIFAHWNGGSHYRATYRGYGVAAELYHREPEALGEDDLGYGDWEWMNRKSTPKLLADGMEAVVDRIAAAMQTEKEAMEARTAEESAKFAADQLYE